MSMMALAQQLQSQGRGGDTILAHINPAEAAMLEAAGGSGTLNPETGLPVFTAQDKEAILSKNGAVIERLATKALGNSGLSEKAVDEAQARFPEES